jgi:hypothetical protein
MFCDRRLLQKEFAFGLFNDFVSSTVSGHKQYCQLEQVPQLEIGGYRLKL